MKLGLLKSCMFYFQLRQGTILIAIVQLVLSGYIIIFLTLSLTHESRIQDMIARDTEDVLEREALEEITSKHINSHRMELAHHDATEKIYLIYCGLVVMVVNFASTILLLYGVLMNIRYLMTPWMMVMMTKIVALIISLFLVQERDCPFLYIIGGQDLIDRLLVLSTALFAFYTWLVVYSTYRQMEMKKGVIHEVHVTLNDKKYGHPHKGYSKKPLRQHVALTQAYDV
ncbi:uncharacterized protein LOC131668605 [Phymastichus coffea]|uniref:uncharacterized protein LOC131668605 n=1 Tax=Phymastichus coffea TaxID=108790 RepID=UPI00273C94D8|nr:uncharacterized protein LOC131668605 [Phymastichus coffea]XP_058798904.1 uncharacterized protein LOC131668605 [Phymastichus coffea]XP_058798905.1 uncharacterized protein LOC131668605 [Phymastichus coffea]XP_058798906.1 uncharacterized protein LOC131668605 [Phymastichus coffea]XP_058798907.1 uncharacterized protein LOC131668605 [Phymastichus coffea]